MTYIQYQKGDIFNAQTHVIVNTVNCKGVMGKGLALAFKQKYPSMFPVYQQECKTGKLRIGRPTLYKESTPWILNFPTKDHWKPPSKIEYLQKGLEYFITNYKEAGIKSIAFPKLGAQNGKLSWDEVGPVMARYLSQLDIDVYIYIAEGDKEYQNDTHRENDIQEKIWKQFSELAHSQDRLMHEVRLSPREAKKVASQRESMEITSLADIESISLAKITLKRIKDYLSCQEFTRVELEGMSPTNIAKPHETKSKKASGSSRRSPKKLDVDNRATVEPLFPVNSLTG
jgi:O-acetyl-ADP-ribose deacetylase (regulator of RNase III)